MVDKSSLVSVIIPVYNVKPYLHQCLDSVINQTYRNLEILIIDDGSTDGCGKICDEYTKKDGRIKVFHTENRGLSAARNLGIEKAYGEYLYFLDSDDWIEPSFLDQGISAIGDADILSFGDNVGTYSGIEALVGLINGKLYGHTWLMLFRKKCFSKIRFPEGQIAEDIATSYKLLHQADLVVCAAIKGHHYRRRKGSLSNIHSMKNIFDYYYAVKERYNYCINVFTNESKDSFDRKTYINLQQSLALSIARAWAWRIENQESDSQEWEIMTRLARYKFPYSVRRNFSLRVRGGIFLAQFNHPLSFCLAHMIHILTRRVLDE